MTVEERKKQVLDDCKIVVTDRQIIVTPDISYYDSDSTVKDILDTIMKEIRRHIDNVASVRLNETIIYVCEYCNLEMEFEEGTSIPSCCDVMQQKHSH